MSLAVNIHGTFMHRCNAKGVWGLTSRTYKISISTFLTMVLPGLLRLGARFLGRRFRVRLDSDSVA